MKRSKIFMIAFLCIIFILMSTLPLFAREYIKIAWYHKTGFNEEYSDGTNKSGYGYEYLQLIADNTGWRYIYVPCTYQQGLDMLKKGDVDIIGGVTKQPDLLLSHYPIGEKNGAELYFAFNPRKSDLQKEFNEAQRSVVQKMPLYHDGQQDIYEHKKIVLTDKEKAYLDKHKTIKAGYMQYQLPYCDRDMEEDKMTGVLDIALTKMENLYHIKIERVSYDTYPKMLKALKNKEIDIMMPVYADRWLAEKEDIAISDMISTTSMVALYRGTYNPNIFNNIAVATVTPLHSGYVQKYYPLSKHTEYRTEMECWDAVYQGKADCTFINTVTYEMVQQTYPPHLHKFNAVEMKEEVGIGIGLSKDDTVLIGLTDKAIESLDESEINAALVKYAQVAKRYTWMEFVANNVKDAAIIVIVIILTIVSIFICYIITARNHQRKLQQMFESETRALERAEKAQAEADRANRYKSEFLSRMSHDIRTPMNIIVGMVDICRRHSKEENKVLDCLDKIQMSSEHLQTLINDILDMSSIESGKMQVNPQEVDILELADRLVVSSKTLVEKKGLSFECNIHDLTQKYIISDGLRLYQIFLNLLSNAIKYTEVGGSVYLEMSEEEVSDDELVLTTMIKDTGIGMSPEFMKEMYTSFSRVANEKTKGIIGTGLGLAIVKHLVDFLNGTIDVESAVGEGTCFTVKFRVNYIVKDEDKAANDNDVDLESYIGLKVLIAEDNDLNYEIAEEMLSMYNIMATRAEDGQQCVDIFKNSAVGEYAIILMDMQMPNMDGMEATREIRKCAHPEAKTMPIVAMTANAFLEDIQKCLEAGMQDHLAKPVTIAQLVEMISKYSNKD